MGQVKIKVSNFVVHKSEPFEEVEWYPLASRIDKASCEVKGQIKIQLSFEILPEKDGKNLIKVVEECVATENVRLLSKLLTKNRFDLDLTVVEESLGLNLLEYAVHKENCAVIELLQREFQVNVGRKNPKSNMTPIIYAITQGKRALVVKTLLSVGADYKVTTEEGDTLLHLAAAHFSASAELVRLLLDEPYRMDVDAQNNRKETALFKALESASFVCVSELLESGANVNHVNYKGETPLHVALRLSVPEHVISKLLSNGGDVDKKNSGGQTAFDLATSSQVKRVLATLGRSELYGGMSWEELSSHAPLYKDEKEAIDVIWKKWQILAFETESYEGNGLFITKPSVVGRLIREMKLLAYISKFAGIELFMAEGVDYDELIGISCMRMWASEPHSLKFCDLIRGLSLMQKGELEERLSYHFLLFDKDRNGSISKQEAISWYKMIAETKKRVETKKIAKLISEQVKPERQDKALDVAVSGPLHEKINFEARIFADALFAQISSEPEASISMQQYVSLLKNPSALYKAEAAISTSLQELKEKYKESLEKCISEYRDL